MVERSFYVFVVYNILQNCLYNENLDQLHRKCYLSDITVSNLTRWDFITLFLLTIVAWQLNLF